MLFRLLFNVGIENILNIFLHTPLVLESTYLQLDGKVLSISLKNFTVPIILSFNKYHINVLSEWNDNIDCSITTYLSVLPKLYNYRKFATLIHNGDLIIEGDLQIIQNFIILLNLLNSNLEVLFTPFVNDILIESIIRYIRYWNIILYKKFSRMQDYIVDIITEEWRCIPGSLEVAWFIEENTVIKYTTKILEKRLKSVENK